MPGLFQEMGMMQTSIWVDTETRRYTHRPQILGQDEWYLLQLGRRALSGMQSVALCFVSAYDSIGDIPLHHMAKGIWEDKESSNMVENEFSMNGMY